MDQGQRLFAQQRYDEASLEFWKAVLLHDGSYDVQAVFAQFLKCYAVQNRVGDGLAFVASESFKRGQRDMGERYLGEALQVDPQNALARQVQQEFMSEVLDSDEEDEYANLSPEDLYELASERFSLKQYEACADLFELSCQRSNQSIGPSCANAVYCRSMITDWGWNGTRFEADMERITQLTKQEVHQFRFSASESNEHFAWRRATSVHPHMMLGYPVDPMLKRYVTESVAYMDEAMARVDTATGQLTPLPDDLPYQLEDYRESLPRDGPLRVGFVGSGFNSKAVLFLSQDMFRFFDESQFEIHIFSFGPPDHPHFIEHGMRGVDWRKRVQANVHAFHDVEGMRHIEAARFIHEQGIHILIEWDGYARQGERAQGLFALRPAPVQILHQEYLGTSGAQYVDYLFTDLVTSPRELEGLYTEKLIYLPNHFFSKGHAYHKEVKDPTYDYLPKTTPYRVGHGSPRENKCLSNGPEPTFVFCNFNKFLKNNPETMRSWIRILREVPGAILCLLENPQEGTVYLRKYIHEAAATLADPNDHESFLSGDGDDLNSRIHFLPWENNPFDHQMRNQDFCNVMLDSFPYNGHTMAQDALYGGVPIVTRSDGDDMASRVTTSANEVLGMTQLNAYEGPPQYEDIAIRLGNDEPFYQEMRNHLIGTALQRNPMHRYWDVARYVKNFEDGMRQAWANFLADDKKHIFVQESEAASRGTYDDEIEAHPAEGRRRSITNEL